MEDNRIKLLSTGSISKAVMKMALPSIIGLLVLAIYNIVDTMFVAWLGTQATGATQIVFPITMALGAVGLTFGIGGSSYVSRLLGENKKERAEQVVSTNFYSALGLGIIITILGILFIEPILRLFGATDTIMPLSRDYGIFILLGATAQITNMTLNNLLRGEGSAKLSMIAMVTGAVLNIFLDPIFIFGLGLGIKGAAIATSLSQFVTIFMLIRPYLAKKTLLHLHFKNVSYDSELIIEVLKMGSPSFARNILTSVSMALLNNAAALYGSDAAVAAIGIVSRTMMIVMYIIFGLSQGFQPVAGYNYGAKSYTRLKEALDFTVKLSIGISVISCALFVIFDEAVLSIYNPTETVMSMGSEFLVYYAFSTILMAYTNVISAYYQAIGRGMPALLLSLARQGIFLIPAILILPKWFEMTGIYVSQPVADILTLALTMVLFIPSLNKLKLLISDEKQSKQIA
jgi:putative MATE family efflux protein